MNLTLKLTGYRRKGPQRSEGLPLAVRVNDLLDLTVNFAASLQLVPLALAAW